MKTTTSHWVGRDMVVDNEEFLGKVTFPEVPPRLTYTWTADDEVTAGGGFLSWTARRFVPIAGLWHRVCFGFTKPASDQFKIDQGLLYNVDGYNDNNLDATATIPTPAYDGVSTEVDFVIATSNNPLGVGIWGDSDAYFWFNPDLQYQTDIFNFETNQAIEVWIFAKDGAAAIGRTVDLTELIRNLAQYAIVWGFSDAETTLQSKAEGVGSSAGGIATSASGEASTAEGVYSEALGLAAHAEGFSNLAAGPGSHAEGAGTTATGFNSHSEGEFGTAQGVAAHSEGRSSVAQGMASHAEGGGNVATGNYSHAEGFNNQAMGMADHAEGYGTLASGGPSHAEGQQTTASGNMSHAQGNGCTAEGFASHAEGDHAYARGNYEHAHSGGAVTGTLGDSQFVRSVGPGVTWTGTGSLTLLYLPLLANQAMTIRGMIIVRTTSTNDFVGWSYQAVARKAADGTVPSLLGKVFTKVGASAGATTWTADLVADADELRLVVSGGTGTNHASITLERVEVL